MATLEKTDFRKLRCAGVMGSEVYSALLICVCSVVGQSGNVLRRLDQLPCIAGDGVDAEFGNCQNHLVEGHFVSRAEHCGAGGFKHLCHEVKGSG
jgi:hypothetical protein